MSLKSAKLILPKVFGALPSAESVVDFGPGAGDWIIAASELGVADENLKCYGLPEEVKIPEDLLWRLGDVQAAALQEIIDAKAARINKWFGEADLNAEKSIITERKYDLAVCLEVAEHLQPESAENLIATLTGASDFVLFSAAVPYQWGEGHVNIRWPSYWSGLFEAAGYKAADFLRYQFWDTPQDEVEVHYKQNMVLYAKKERYKELKLPEFDYSNVLNLAHPYLYCTIHGESYGDPNRKY